MELNILFQVLRNIHNYLKEVETQLTAADTKCEGDRGELDIINTPFVSCYLIITITRGEGW